MLQNQDILTKLLSAGTAATVITVLELSTLLAYVIHNFITSSHNNKVIRKFKVLKINPRMKKGYLKMECHC